MTATHSSPPPAPAAAPPFSSADYWLAARRCDLQGLEHLARLGRVVIATSNLVHALQNERGLSNLLVGSGNAQFRDTLSAHYPQVDREQAAFFQALQLLQADTQHHQGAYHQGGSRLFRRLAYAVHSLSSLPDVRAQVSALSVQPLMAIQAYSEMIQSLLTVVFETSDIAADDRVARVLVAMFNLMQGKELAGQERANGAAGFAALRFDALTRDRLQHLIDRQEHCFRIFTDYADETALLAWQTVESGGFQKELERLRRRMLTGRDDRLEPALALRWFECCSARMDAIKQVEDCLEVQLLSCCQARILAAREALTDAEQGRENAAFTEFNTVPGYAVYISEHELTQRAASECSPVPDSPTPRPGRTLMDLLNTQAQRMKIMDEELSAVRTELHERKVIDRAKRELILHRGLSEPEAHKWLRQMAMNQSRRLIDVAESLLSMTDLLKPSP